MMNEKMFGADLNFDSVNEAVIKLVISRYGLKEGDIALDADGKLTVKPEVLEKYEVDTAQAFIDKLKAQENREFVVVSRPSTSTMAHGDAGEDKMPNLGSNVETYKKRNE